MRAIALLIVTVFVLATSVVDGRNSEASELIDPPEGHPQENFGEAIAISRNGNVLAVGAPDGLVAEIRSGVVDVFERNDGGAWRHVTRLSPVQRTENASFGSSVALSNSGDVLAIGAFAEDDLAGAAYVFSRAGDGWRQIARLTGSSARTRGDHFGWSVALSADGTRLAVGADGAAGDAGAVHLFERSEDTWSRSAVISPPPDRYSHRAFGRSVALSSSGSALAVGAPGDSAAGPLAGAVHLYVLQAHGPVPVTKLHSPTPRSHAWFGQSVAVSADGRTVIVGAPGDEERGQRTGAAYAFTADENGVWKSARLPAGTARMGDMFGWAVALSPDGSRAIIGAPEADDAGRSAGKVSVLEKVGSGWKFAGAISGSKSGYRAGRSVAASGRRVLIGAPGAGVHGFYSGAVTEDLFDHALSMVTDASTPKVR